MDSATEIAVSSEASSASARRDTEKGRARVKPSAEQMQAELNHGLAPGSFFFHGKLHQLSPRSLGLCASHGATGKVRSPIVWYVVLLLSLRLP